MIEFLIITSCLGGTGYSCEQGASAYYVYSGIQESVSKKTTEYSRNYPVASHIVAYGAAAAQGTLIINLSHGKSLTLDAKRSILNFKGEF